MTRRCAGLALATLLAVTSCDDRESPAITEPVVPVTPGTTRPSFSLHASLSLDERASDSIPTWRLAAHLDAGYEDGQPRPANDTLWIDGEPLLPERVDVPQRRYRFEESVDPATVHQRTIRVRPPTVDGVSVDAISFALVGRAGTDTLFRTPAGDVVLPILLPAAPPDPTPSLTTWNVTIGTPDTRVARIDGYDAPAAPLHIPSYYLPPAGSGTRVLFTARFHRFPRSEPGPTEYFATYTVSSNFEWLIRPVP